MTIDEMIKYLRANKFVVKEHKGPALPGTAVRYDLIEVAASRRGGNRFDLSHTRVGALVVNQQGEPITLWVREVEGEDYEAAIAAELAVKL